LELPVEKNNDLRYELKIPLEGIPLYEIRKWINLHPHAFEKTFPPRRVNNLYFDTIDYNNLQAHLDGYYKRNKFRLRWYGNVSAFPSSNLEIKSKLGNLGNKTTYKIHKEINLVTYSHGEIIQTIANQLPNEIALMLFNCQPVMINYYQREYFESLQNGIRLTIDYDQFAFDQQFSAKPNLSFSEPFHNSPIIEIKAPKHKYKILSEVLSLFPASTNRFSKYLDGMLSILSR
jgi:hypothetical protein